MEKLKYYDEAANNFYKNWEPKSFTLNSLDFHAAYFDKICKDLKDAANLSELAKQQKWHGEIPFRTQILEKDRVVVVTDPQLKIVYASQNMYAMSGYRPDEVLGKNPGKMFQGEQTSEATKKEVSDAIRQQRPFDVVLVNYTKNGAPYKCWIQGSPIFDKSGKVVNFIAFEKEVA